MRQEFEESQTAHSAVEEELNDTQVILVINVLPGSNSQVPIICIKFLVAS